MVPTERYGWRFVRVYREASGDMNANRKWGMQFDGIPPLAKARQG